MQQPSQRPQVLKGGVASKLRQEEATAAYVASPKGISKKTPAGHTLNDSVPTTTNNSPTNAGELGKTRRRLSVVSDNKLVDGMAHLATNDNGEVITTINSFATKTLAVTTYAGISKKGYAPYNPRKKNQDALVMTTHEDSKTLLLCVFDGHGEVGDHVSQYFKDNITNTLFNHSQFLPTGNIDKDAIQLQKVISDSLDSLEKKLLKDNSIDTEFSGTTGVICMIRGHLLIVGNVGDSRITRGYIKEENTKNQIIAEPISIDHKPDRPDEKKRIIGMGGRVFAVEYDDGIDGPPRVWLGHMDVPGLAMSRSLGDTVAHSAGVSSEPEFFIHKFDKNDRYIVIATDGLWEFLSDHEVLDIVANAGTEPRKAVDLLITEANARWMKEEQVIDDTTVIVANIKI